MCIRDRYQRRVHGENQRSLIIKREMSKEVKERKAIEAATRDYTINLHRLCHRISFKEKAPRAIKEIVKFAQRNMLTEDVRVDTRLNQHLWSHGIRNIPRKVRVRLSRRRNEDDEGKGRFYTLVQFVPVSSFTSLRTEKNTGKQRGPLPGKQQ
eukprot:TRINITY_DN6153_c0_g1_i1.p1 TRINITY_DN6153_c0_g1~~TRINITY_DN6153_c0_g1_i1.p1  ORF type:complete len:176 (-),score=74.71 TRINITY_DN6153_c0_g1_i1:346-804(-)